MNEPPFIEELNYETAESLMADLSPVARLWGDTGGVWDENDAGGRRNWIFRGQQLSDWELSPRAMRPGEFVYYAIGKKAIEHPKTLEEQVKNELQEVLRFVRRCVRSGLSLPEDGQWFRNGELVQRAFGLNPINGVDFPFPLDRSLFALAQHHGVPTRLLDWTESPLVAAYFACHKAAAIEKERRQRDLDRTLEARRAGSDRLPESVPPTDRLALFALRQSAFYTLRNAFEIQQLEPTIEVVEAPFDANPNLRAQRGLFTLVRYHTPRQQQDYRLPSVETVIVSYQKASLRAANNTPWLRKLTLPHVEAPRLLRMLDQFNVNAGTIFPGYDGVVQSIREREFFE